MASAYLRKHWKHEEISINLGVSKATTMRFKEMFDKACYQAFLDQSKGPKLGGTWPDGSPKPVEIDETLFVRAKGKKGSKRWSPAVWVLGMIERYSKKRVYVPLINISRNEKGNHVWHEILKRDTATLVPLIQTYVAPGSLIFSDGWTAYLALKENGFLHGRIIHQRHWCDPDNPSHHTNTIERSFGDLKEWTLRRGARKEKIELKVGRYLWIKNRKPENVFHDFLTLLAEKYKHPLFV